MTTPEPTNKRAFLHYDNVREAVTPDTNTDLLLKKGIITIPSPGGARVFKQGDDREWREINKVKPT